jgi:hypothetical protein
MVTTALRVVLSLLGNFEVEVLIAIASNSESSFEALIKVKVSVATSDEALSAIITPITFSLGSVSSSNRVASVHGGNFDNSSGGKGHMLPLSRDL